jgi:6-phosphofructokinase 1
MKRIAVLTSGGDAPGMNAAIRAVVRTGVDRGWDVFGVRHGYLGLIGGDLVPLGRRDVSGIVQLGGTMLGSARCPEFKTEEGRMQALRSLNEHDIEALVVIGGNGSQTGAHALSQMGFPVVGVASTIDNDLYGSEVTIGVDTALNIALEAIDRLKVTASSHQRAFLVEVMGRECGYLALMSGIAGGAEAVVIPEAETDPEAIATELCSAYERGKSHALVVVAEGARYNTAGSVLSGAEGPVLSGAEGPVLSGAEGPVLSGAEGPVLSGAEGPVLSGAEGPVLSGAEGPVLSGAEGPVLGGAEGLAAYFEQHRERLGFELRVTILGHVQRGGAPGAFDRLLASRLGAAATEHLAQGEHGLLVGLLRGEIVATSLADVVANRKPLDTRLLELAQVLAR